MTFAATPPVELSLAHLSAKQKWDLVRVLLDELSDAPGTAENDAVPAWHLEVLAEREQQLNAGQTEFMELEDFIAEVRADAS